MRNVGRHAIDIGNLWGPTIADRLTTLAIAGGVAGCVGAVSVLPSAVLLLAVGGFLFVGPGSLLMSWFTELPAEAVYALIPVVGLAIGILVASGLLLLGVYAPLPILLVAAAATLGGGLLRRRQLGAQKESVH